MAEYTEHDVQELKERIRQLEFESQEKSEERLRLKKDNERLYQGVKQATQQSSDLRTELESSQKFYKGRIETLAAEKAELARKLDVLQTEFDRINGVYTSASEARESVRRESLELMDKVRETSMDAVTMIDFIRKDIRRLKLDLDNLAKAGNTTADDIDEEIQLMLDLLNTHSEKLGTIRSGFYAINNITEYDSGFDDLSLSREESRLENGNYVD